MVDVYPKYNLRASHCFKVVSDSGNAIREAKLDEKRSIVRPCCPVVGTEVTVVATTT